VTSTLSVVSPCVFFNPISTDSQIATLSKSIDFKLFTTQNDRNHTLVTLLPLPPSHCHSLAFYQLTERVNQCDLDPLRCLPPLREPRVEREPRRRAGAPGGGAQGEAQPGEGAGGAVAVAVGDGVAVVKWQWGE
jgi:hypothetical protein